MDISVAAAPHLRRVGRVLCIASLIAIGIATLLPQPPGAAESHFCIVCGSFGGVDAVLNVVLFVPLGIGLALYGIRRNSVVIGVCILSAAIEIAQFLLIPGRDSTVGDVITNTVGGAIGFVIARYATIWTRPTSRAGTRLAAAIAVVWLTIQAISSFGFIVELPNAQYHGQLARTLGHFAVFSGVVLEAQVGDTRLVDAPLNHSAEVRDELLHGAVVAATIAAAAPPNAIAPIVRIVDSRGRQIVLLAQQERDFLFGIRTGAAALRLRQPYFGLRRAFPGVRSAAVSADDTLVISGAYTSGGASLTAQREHARYGRRIGVTSSMSWVMLLPFQWTLEGTSTEAAISMLWIALLLGPMGYWAWSGAVSSSPSIRRKLLRVAAFVGVVLFFGLLVVPHLFGVQAAPLRDWIAALAAIASGAGLALILAEGAMAPIQPARRPRDGRE
jgi:hypothetical protein